MVILVVDFSFNTLNISCHSLLACRVSTERSTVNHMGFPLYVTCSFSLAAFNILSLCLISVSLINMCLDKPWVYPVRDSLHFLDLIDYFLSHVGEVFNYNFFKNFLSAFFFSSFETPITQMLVHLICPKDL